MDLIFLLKMIYKKFPFGFLGITPPNPSNPVNPGALCSIQVYNHTAPGQQYSSSSSIHNLSSPSDRSSIHSALW
jgi:hypothetical protein